LIEPVQVRWGDLNLTDLGEFFPRFARRCLTFGQTLRGLNNQIGMQGGFPAAPLDRLLYSLDRMLGQQLQDPDVVPRPSRGTIPGLELLSQRSKDRRQFPVAKHRRMIQRRRPSAQNRQIMLLLHDQLAPLVTPPMRSHHRALGHHVDPIDIRLDRDLLKGPATGDGIAIGVVADGLVFIDFGLLGDTGIEGTSRQG
jgi:hypothetical protein